MRSRRRQYSPRRRQYSPRLLTDSELSDIEERLAQSGSIGSSSERDDILRLLQDRAARIRPLEPTEEGELDDLRNLLNSGPEVIRRILVQNDQLSVRVRELERELADLRATGEES